jgi:endonuclease/exonuclease/phosphatase family metal-dependent hydrolase
LPLKLASYNIHACIGTDGLFDPFRVAAVINEIDADIIALQEVEHHLVNDIDLLDFLSQQTGMTGLAGPTMLRETRHYGNAILTRLPIVSHQLLDLSHRDYEPRGAIVVRHRVEDKDILVCATHFGLKPHERRHQVREILSYYESEQSDVALLMGDLNEWFLWGRPLRWLRRFFDTTPAPRSFPSGFPLLALDRIWCRPRSLLTSVSLHRTKLSEKASDHLPVTGLIDLS